MNRKVKTVQKLVLLCLALLSLSSCGGKTILEYYEDTPRGREDVTGWEKVNWGMSVEEVDNLYPLSGDFKADKGLFEPGLAVVDGHFYKSQVNMPHNYWEDLPWVASFYFDKNDSTGKLVRVKLMLMTGFAKLGFEQSSQASFFRFIIKKHGWPYRYHPVKGEETTVYHWWTRSGAIQARITKNKIKDGTWNYILTVNYLSKEHPAFGDRYNRR